MEQTIVRLQRQYHQQNIDCNERLKYVLGRDIRRGQPLDPNSSFVRCFSEFVSRKHSEIFSDSHGVWKIKDLGSMNGTFLGATKLAAGQQRELRDGDIIGLGVSGMGPFDDNIVISDPNYYIFKFTEESIPSDTELIDLTDNDDACTVISTPSTRSFPTTSSKKLPPKTNNLNLPSTSSSMKSEILIHLHEGRNKYKRNPETDSMKSSSSKENKNYERSSSRSISPKIRLKNKHERPKKHAHNYLTTSSEDDSSDGLPELNRENNNSPTPVRNKSGSSVTRVTFEKQILSSKEDKKMLTKEKNYSKTLQSVVHESKDRTNILQKRQNDQEQSQPSEYESETKATLHQFSSCSVKLSNVFQVNGTGNLVLTPLVQNSLVTEGCNFAMASQREQHVNSRGPASRKVDADKKKLIENEEDSDSHPPKKLKIVPNKSIKCGLLDHENERSEENRPVQKEKDREKGYRPAPLSKSKAHACVRPIRRKQIEEDRDELIKSTLHVEDEEKTLEPVEYSRNNSDDERDNGYQDDLLAMDIDNEDLAGVGNEIDADDFESMEVVAQEDNESLSRIISHNINKAKAPQRQIKLLDDAPSPTNRRRKGLGTVDRVSVIPSGAVPTKSSSDWRTTDAVSCARKRMELLKQISAKDAKEKAEKELKVQEEVFKKPMSIPKVKNSHKSRSESLLVSMVGSVAAVENLDKQCESIPGSSNKPTAQPRELPRPSPEEVAKMPLHNLLKSNLKVPSVHDPRREKIIPPLARNNLLQKPNAIVNPNSDSNDSHQFHILNKRNEQGRPHKNHNREIPVLLDDSIYKDICHWNASWLKEQKSIQHPPAVEVSPYRPPWKVISVLNVYNSYEAYQSVFYPLMLHELWASVFQDYEKNEKTRGMEHKVGIESVLLLDSCPSTPSMDPAGPKQGQWFDLRCHAFVNNKKDFRTDLDLCLLRYYVKCKNSKNQDCVSEKANFVFFQYNSDKIEQINSKAIVHNNLFQQNPEFKLKVTFNIYFHVNLKPSEKFSIVTEKVALLKRISYISPTVRNYKALIHLPRFPLYQNILNPRKPDSPWQFNEHARYDSLVSYCNPLNPRQKSIIDYVSNRIMKNPGKSEIMLIHGPPGTGKTRTIVGLILQIMTSNEFKREKPKVLVCTPSNTAIDEIIARLHEIFKTMNRDQRPSLVRIGELNRVSELSSQYTPDHIAHQKVTSASAYDSINITIKQKLDEIKEKEMEKASLMHDAGKMTILRALDREIKEMKLEVEKLEANKRLVLTATRSDQEHLEKIKVTAITSAQIVCSTLNSCSNSKLKNSFDVITRKQGSSKPLPKFTFCIVDEATQTTEPESLAPLTFNIDKLVLVGDPMQLDATVVSQKAKENSYGRSLYHRLYETYSKLDPSPVMMLRDQYRMHEEILKWPNDSFYGGKLIKKPIRKHFVPCPLPPYLFFNLISRESADNGKISNDDETVLVVEILKSIWTQLNRKHKFSIGVITPYGRQKDVLFKTIKEKVPEFADVVEVDTVDSFQGREKDIVLISCVRSDTIGFLNNPKRLNVALTRAIHSLFIIGNADCLRKDDMWESLIEDAEYRKLIHSVPKDKAKQPGLLANFLRPILSSSRT